jgi:hypothetical protein
MGGVTHNWLKSNSIFKNYIPENSEKLKSCFEHDVVLSHIQKKCKNLREYQEVKELL